MGSKKISISEIENKLNKDKELFPEYIAENICKLFSTIEISDKERDNIKKKFQSALERWGEFNLLNSKIDYAIKLMTYNSSLEYEEIHLLYSLFDSIYSMESIGLIPNKALKKAYEGVQNEFIFKKEAVKSRLVAHDRMEEWKRQWKWYQV